MPQRSPAPPKYLYPEIGEAVAAQRRKRGWSQSELARRLGMSRGSVANLEVGRQRVTLPTLWAIARIYRIEVHLLIPRRRARSGGE